jgi:hypothetical protein
MLRLGRLASLARGTFWLIRGGGLRQQLQELEDHLAAFRQELSGTMTTFPGKIDEIRQEIRDQFLQESQPTWVQSGDLRAFEKRVSSQNGEDGIIQEIFNRIGSDTRYFVEFGVETGIECNCARLVREEHWRGLFMESDPGQFARLTERYRDCPGVQTWCAAVTSANIEELLAANRVPKNFDLLSIDIDGNDYWVWAAIKHWRPRVVVIEYNASYPPPRKWVMKENPNHRWDGTNYYGASLASLAALGKQKGYLLVGTTSNGVNAFLVRDDLAGGNKFLDPVVHYHFSPAGYGPCMGSHPSKTGPHVEI